MNDWSNEKEQERPPTPIDDRPTHRDGIRKNLVYGASWITAVILVALVLVVFCRDVATAEEVASIILHPWLPIYSTMIAWYFAKSH